MRSGEHLLEVTQASHHGDNMILDVTEIETDIHTRSDFVICVATFGETFENISLQIARLALVQFDLKGVICNTYFATKKLHQSHDILADHAYLSQESIQVVGPSNKDLIINRICLLLNITDDRGKRINNVIARLVSIILPEIYRGFPYIKA